MQLSLIFCLIGHPSEAAPIVLSKFIPCFRNKKKKPKNLFNTVVFRRTEGDLSLLHNFGTKKNWIVR